MRLLIAGLMLVLASPGWAQDSVIVIDPNAPPTDSLLRAGPPPEVVAELIALYNDSAATRMQGDVTLPAGSRFEGKLALFRGSLRIAGRVIGAGHRGQRHPVPPAGSDRSRATSWWWAVGSSGPSRSSTSDPSGCTGMRRR